MTRQQIVNRDRDILGGTPVFAGTRVPVQNLIDYLAAGDDLDEFLDDFPSVRREQAIAFLEESKNALLIQLGDAKRCDGKEHHDQSVVSGSPGPTF